MALPDLHMATMRLLRGGRLRRGAAKGEAREVDERSVPLPAPFSFPPALELGLRARGLKPGPCPRGRCN